MFPRTLLTALYLLTLLFANACCQHLKQTSPPIFTHKPFIVVWNAPTQDCKPRYKVELDVSMFDVAASPNEGFVDQKLTIFYKERLGLYPYYSSDRRDPINGGLPQNGSIEDHLGKLQESINKYIRSANIEGLAVIDWEEWRPLWIRNWHTKDIYRNLSNKLVAEKHSSWSVESVAKQAQYDFENSAKDFMLRTLQEVKNLRPMQLWGYYLFPDCYNHDYKTNLQNYTGSCPDVEQSRNDQLFWLWQESTALYPSIYLDSKLASSPNSRRFVRARVKEAMRISNLHHQNYSLPVFVYTRPTYTYMVEELSQMDLEHTIGESAALGAAGAIVWGDNDYGKSAENCQKIKDYLKTKMGHYILNVSTAAHHCSNILCMGNGRCRRKDSNSDTYLHLSPGSFRIQSLGLNGRERLTAIGKPSLRDIEEFQKGFQCQCYRGWLGPACKDPDTSGAQAARRQLPDFLLLLGLSLLVILFY
ncbi:hyaluronidase-2 [Latimeria chalumnae]|uniref:hyaluronidase-2 n=1 Tax=Latimeria chalumnae TaxID=7897 RepID=UPI0003C1A218|nr:PREDICTED: hyaluronidase-2 [Latimeria chalumnae]XP_014344187.1 PREDICTED: hyaluronidase-2 [Latimeria chalumnae]|eukprot:XP_005987079.1 PREDICTED: hyaluronidase-2 [Latimeria chalumnae]